MQLVAGPAGLPDTPARPAPHRTQQASPGIATADGKIAHDAALGSEVLRVLRGRATPTARGAPTPALRLVANEAAGPEESPRRAQSGGSGRGGPSARALIGIKYSCRPGWARRVYCAAGRGQAGPGLVGWDQTGQGRGRKPPCRGPRRPPHPSWSAFSCEAFGRCWRGPRPAPSLASGAARYSLPGARPAPPVAVIRL